jgi:signal peptidase I
VSTRDTSAAAPESGSSWLETIGVVIGAVVLALLIQQFLVKPYKIPSESMVPTLVKGQRVLVNRLGNNFGEPKVGQVWVFNPPTGAGLQLPQEQCGAPRAPGSACVKAAPGELGEAYVKRVVGGPGDRLEVREGHVIRNGKEVDESYAQTCGGEVCNLAPFTVPADQWFMMGDNRGNSDDGRYWGPVTRDHFIGRAFATYWPPKRIGGI